MNAAHISYILYALSLGVVRLVFKLMLVEVGIKFDFMHIICTSAWAEWEGPDWLIEYPRGDYTYISVRCDDGSAIAIVY